MNFLRKKSVFNLLVFIKLYYKKKDLQYDTVIYFVLLNITSRPLTKTSNSLKNCTKYIFWINFRVRAKKNFHT